MMMPPCFSCGCQTTFSLAQEAFFFKHFFLPPVELWVLSCLFGEQKNNPAFILKLGGNVARHYVDDTKPFFETRCLSIFGGSLENPVAESTKHCCRAYKKFVADYPNYDVDVKLCAFSAKEMQEAQKVFDSMI